MRIVYIHQYFRTPEMSGGTRSYEFGRRLVERGHDVHVVTSDGERQRQVAGREKWQLTVEAGMKVHWAAVPYSNGMKYGDRLGAFGRFARLAAARSASIDQDLVLATSTPLTVALPGAYTHFRRRVPMVLEIRDLWPEVPIALGALSSPGSRKAAWALEAWAYRRADHIVALSPDMSRNIHMRYPDIPISVIPNSSDIQLFAGGEASGQALRVETPWLKGRPFVLYAGALGKVNGVQYIVRLAEALKRIDADTRIGVVGSGGTEQEVRELALRLGVLDDNLFMLPAVSKRDVVGFFGACNLALSTVIDVPALGANSANKVFDAFAAGRPVGINHAGWLADVIRSSGAGVLLPPESPQDAAIIVARFLRDPRGLLRANAAARSLAEQRFDRDTLASQLENVLVAARARYDMPRR